MTSAPVDQAADGALLEVDGLDVRIRLPQGELHAVRNVSFNLAEGETLCLVGESGCGKSLTSLTLMGLLPKAAQRSARKLSFAGQDLQSLSEARMSAMRGNDVAMIFQEPMTSLNPSMAIGAQLTEGFLKHKKGSAREARERALYLMDKAGIPSPAMRMRQYPHELSGGLRQRVMIAMALMCSPRLIIADEPTTALDVTIQAQILDLLKALQSDFGMAILLITHDLGVVARVADRVSVMYAGEIVEQGDTQDVFRTPTHPYTQGLLDCVPIPGRLRPGERLGFIPGQVPNLMSGSKGCMFRNRCGFAMPQCVEASVPLVSGSEPGHRYRCLLPLTTENGEVLR
ncbi:MAG TPA: ABC transporter ATP-binding protein [Burkholderiaceae bacterium]|nr:ABC transporter ATP-binding protein [Burkholderiaceae bacterium]